MKVLLLVPGALLALLTACGGDGTTVADPAASSTGSPSPTAEESETASSGVYPSYAPTDYSYTLSVSCFCLDAGVPIRIRVEDGEVTRAVYARGGRGVQKGADADEFRRITINDVIDAANDPRAEKVQVEWPEGQDHPTRVSIDRSEMVADDEITYEISAVSVAR
ncbi:DUF6174 domain-containing protein [Nocardioides sp.]|uniref:DUF6174 domain-containing protein n=1 Tax=Nocardioides sp. TaxID=35761 RepID=UPI0035627123